MIILQNNEEKNIFLGNRRGRHARMLKTTVILILIFTAIYSLSGCAERKDTESAETQTKVFTPAQRKVIIDTDTGADDSSALILAAKSPGIEILGVTVMAGNVDIEQSTKNALAALEIAGCDAPVYQGSDERCSGKKIEVFSVFGKDGMGEADLIHPSGKAQDKDAIDFILETVKENPGEVEIIALGPATNIAKAIERDRETMMQVKMIWSLGTTGYGHGNASPVAEFNAYSDIDAYKVMTDSGIPLTVVGLDMCGGDAMWTGEQFEELSKANDIGRFVAKSFSKIREFYAANGSENAVMNCDSLAMMCVVYTDFVSERISCHAECITEEGQTYGQVIFYQKGFTYDVVSNDYDYNAELVRDVNGADYFRLYLDAISS